MRFVIARIFAEFASVLDEKPDGAAA